MHYYATGPIDYWHGLKTVDEYCDIRRAIESHDGDSGEELTLGHIAHILTSLSSAMRNLHGKCWAGDFKEGPFIFFLPSPEQSCLMFGFAWKHANNGDTFIASPFPLPWLEEYEVE